GEYGAGGVEESAALLIDGEHRTAPASRPGRGLCCGLRSAHEPRVSAKPHRSAIHAGAVEPALGRDARRRQQRRSTQAQSPARNASQSSISGSTGNWSTVFNVTSAVMIEPASSGLWSGSTDTMTCEISMRAG